MTDGNFAVLFAPIFALVMVMATGLFVYTRVMRYGRVFNWPPIPEKSGPPPASKRGDK